MAVHLRLTRKGSKKFPFYRIVAIDQQMPRDGRFLEIIGTYDPAKKEAVDGVTIKEERVAYWLSQGAQPSETVKSLFKKLGFYKRRTDKIRAERAQSAQVKSGVPAGA